MSDAHLLETLAETEGYTTTDALLEDSVFDSLCPAICTNPGCGYTSNLEPDQDRGWCEICSENSMKSALILAGLI
ncbi:MULTISPECIES: hypothetical protein [Primorskyibacter]|uniref:Uncharacterized protein n=2 Tax=Primorskyibacter TaxID=1068904 RepID=A0A4R3J3Q9_9RHOB|nr:MULTISPECIES: hypothetical protein [Primorskyibacter]TCS59009.1 hypothetical protein EDD52_12339 [Primorskyibacter sedentarius]SMD02415.1 hypothetical protein SAMN06295998_11959 [Primorskyibacter flagellatus]